MAVQVMLQKVLADFPELQMFAEPPPPMYHPVIHAQTPPLPVSHLASPELKDAFLAGTVWTLALWAP